MADKSKGMRGKTTKLSYQSAYPSSGSTWDDLAEINDINGGEKTRDAIELGPRLDGPEFVEKIPGDKKQGDFSATLNYYAAQRDDLEALDDGEIHSFKITWPDGATDVFAGYVSKIGMGKVGANDKLTCEIAIAVTVESVFTPAGS